MWRHDKWLAVVLLVLGAPGCLGGGDAEVASRSAALSLAGGFEGIADELATEDCVEEARSAAARGHDVVWAAADLLSGIALLEIDGLVSCAAPTMQMSSGERATIVLMRPDPEPAKPDENRPDPEPAKPDENRPDPEPASPDEARPDPEPASPDENRPDPEPAGGGTSGGGEG
jgi:hypothetical protein